MSDIITVSITTLSRLRNLNGLFITSSTTTHNKDRYDKIIHTA
jgi:hypothetical protein